VVEEVLSDEDGEALRDLQGAYARFLGIDVLDTSNEVLLTRPTSSATRPTPGLANRGSRTGDPSNGRRGGGCGSCGVVVVQGRQSWALAREAYEQRIDRLEERVIRILQDKLRCAPPQP
jgi:hypothetical protein